MHASASQVSSSASRAAMTLRRREPLRLRRRQLGDPAIADRGEFVDALRMLSRGGTLVRVSDLAGGWVVGGMAVYTAQHALLEWQLVEEFDNAEGFAGVRYFRLTARGAAFAERASAAWRAMPLGQRLLARLMG
jgi:hypothetical protein